MVRQGVRQTRPPLAIAINAFAATDTTACGVTAFGVSGIVAHAIVRLSDPGASEIGSMQHTPPLKYRRRAFSWQERPQPLASRCSSPKDGGASPACELSLEDVLETVQSMVGISVEADVPLMDAGLDSTLRRPAHPSSAKRRLRIKNHRLSGGGTRGSSRVTGSSPAGST